MANTTVILPKAPGQRLSLVNMETITTTVDNIDASKTEVSPSAANKDLSRANMDASTAVLIHPALGQNVQLGMLYDVRTSQFFGGVSLWDDNIVNAKQALNKDTVQDGEFTYSYSLDEARKNATLNIEGALALDLGIIKAVGSAKYLNEDNTSTHEARMNVSCTVVRRTRYIPQEILASMQHEGKLDDPQYTHFVGEVTEGGSATLSFVQSCSSAENAKKVLGIFKAQIKELTVSGDANLSFSKQKNWGFEGTKISYSGAMAENVTNLEDARRIAGEMPTKLKQQLNTLHYKLLPLKVLDNTVRREIRSLDAGLVNRTAAALRAGTKQLLQMNNLGEQDVFQNSFPVIRKQIMNIQNVFATAEVEFTQAARRLLPELRDGTSDYSTKISELQAAVLLFEQQTKFAEQFISKKYKEVDILQATVASLLADGFENHLGCMEAQSLTDAPIPRLLLSFGGDSINRAQHPLQKSIESSNVAAAIDNDTESDSDDSDDDEWFDNPQTVANVREACSTLRLQRAQSQSQVTFGIAAIDKAYRPSKVTRAKKTKTTVGDIVLDHRGKLYMVTGMLPKAPMDLRAKIEGQTINVEWKHDRSDEEELVIPTTGFVVRYRPRPNTAKDGPFSRATDNEAHAVLSCKSSDSSVAIGGSSNGISLHDDCDYEVELCVQTILGQSTWSSPILERTSKLPSVASRMIDFYIQNQVMLSRSEAGVKPWELDESGAKKSLFVGLTTQAERICTDVRFEGQLAVRIVDVAPTFEPRIRAASTQNQDKTIVVMFAGCSGHGKSTEINAFISYLLGGAVDDAARIMVVDDRGANQASSVTQYVTCYRIRPLSPLFEDKTLLIVDTPGYGDSRGVERDAFVTAAMSEFFRTIAHVNAIIFTCRANEPRTTLLSPVSTYVFSLFAKNVQSCLQTIYTFSDAGAPLARKALTELKWPVENGEIEVNNAAFTVELDTMNTDKVRGWWNMSITGQFQLMQMLLKKPPVSTAGSAAVTQDRLHLERTCELVEAKIFRTANDAQILIANLGALANAVGAAPGEKIQVEEDRAVSKPLPKGRATTLCIPCNSTCHKICAFGDDKDKERCVAMMAGKCTICKGRCSWDEHRNAGYFLEVEKYSKLVVPEDLIKRWNSNNNTLEGALLDAIAAYLNLQEALRTDILKLAQLTEKLKDTALLHDPTALISYVETLIQTARQLGAPPAQLLQLTTAKNTLLLMRKVKEMGYKATSESQTLLQILRQVQTEMNRRMALRPQARAEEEEKPCGLYDNLHDKLPAEIQKKAPPRLKTGIISELVKSGTIFATGAKYPENLQAIIKLIQVVLSDGGVVSAIKTSA